MASVSISNHAPDLTRDSIVVRRGNQGPPGELGLRRGCSRPWLPHRAHVRRTESTDEEVPSYMDGCTTHAARGLSRPSIIPWISGRSGRGEIYLGVGQVQVSLAYPGRCEVIQGGYRVR